MKEREFLIEHDDANLAYYQEFRDQPTDDTRPPQAPVRPPHRYIGKRHTRIDGRKIVTGRARYIHDLQLPGMLYGKILRCPHACAEVVSVDLSDALKMPGVKAALNLVEGRIQYAGQEVAAVAAVDETTAEQALKRIRVKYRPLPHVVIEERAMQPDAPRVHDKPNVEKFYEYSRGDVDRGFAEADVVLERTYRTPVEIHHPTETHCSIARWDGDRLTVWDSTQAIYSVRDGLARALGLPASRVTVIKTYMGGGFGSKLGLNVHTLVAARLARETGRPVKITLTRKENALCVGNRPSSRQTLKGGVKKDGTLTALSLVNYTSGGVRRGDRCCEPLIDLYRCPNVKADEYAVYLNTGAARPTRAPGHVQGIFALECFIDELAAALDMDPLELRRKNYSTRNRGDTGVPYSSKGLDRCYDLGAAAIGWQRRNRKPGAGSGKIRRGIGMASQIWWGVGRPGTQADVRLHRDGSIEVICGTQDIGTGTRTYMATVTAEVLGLDPDSIIVRLGSTDYPWAGSSGGSTTTPSVAPAVYDAARQAAEFLRQMAARELETSPDRVRLENGRAAVLGQPERFVEIRRLMRNLRHDRLFHGEYRGRPSDYAYNTFGAHFAEVEVDTETGFIRVVKVVAVHEIGQVVNRLTAESQVIGGVTQGISYALFEQRIMDEATGNPVNPNLLDYKIVTSKDVPEIVPLFVDMVDPRINDLGAKGLGEPPRIPTAAAIANAVFNAIGVPLRELPMTPDRVLTALKKKEARG